MKRRVCVVIPYFGRWPDCLPLYLQGARRNPWLEVLLFTDLQRPSTFPDNIKTVPFTLRDLEDRLTGTTGLTCDLNSPYRLCDLRPMFGVMFWEELTPYDFWGFGDIDVIYGDLGSFLTEDLLESADVISGSRHWISGPLSLFRNVETVNTLYRQASDLPEILQSAKYMGFDECAFQFKQFRAGRSWDEIDFRRSNLTQLVRRAEAEGQLRPHFADWYSEHLAKFVPSNFFIHSNDAGLFDNEKRKYALHHFKGRQHQRIVKFPLNPSAEFYLDETGFYSPRQFVQPFQFALRTQRNIKLRGKNAWRKATRAVELLSGNSRRRITNPAS